MPKVGDVEFDYTPEGIAEAEAFSEAAGIPVSNAQDRNVQTYIHGGMVRPQTAMGSLDIGRGQRRPPIPRYKKGGKVKGKK